MPVGSRAFKKLQAWYVSNCNDHWEHDYGIKIESLDNPGWMVVIDLDGTAVDLPDTFSRTIQRSEHDWITCEIKRGENGRRQFFAAGGPLNLEELIDIFFDAQHVEDTDD